jgi:hypothetical protein
VLFLSGNLARWNLPSTYLTLRAYYPAFLTLSQIGVAFSYSIVFVEKIADLEVYLILAHTDQV